MMLDHRAFWLPKDIQDESAYQDAYVVDGQRGVAAITDGVSSSLFAGLWAEIVARQAADHSPRLDDGSFAPWLQRCRRQWSEGIDESGLAWHQKPKLREGAATTLLWIEVSSQRSARVAAANYRLQSYAVGDCCLFHVRQNQVLRAFPLEESRLFDNAPRVLRSVCPPQEAQPVFDTLDDVCFPGDLLVLCTDAVAAWALTTLEQQGQPDFEQWWDAPEVQWRQWLLDLRGQNAIRYDDSTLVLLRVRTPEIGKSLVG